MVFVPDRLASIPLAATVRKSQTSDCEKIRPFNAHESAIALSEVIHFPNAFTVPAGTEPTNSTAFLRVVASSIRSISMHDERVLPSELELLSLGFGVD